MCAVIAANTFAQGQGLAGINEATSLMTSYFDPATKLCYAIGAVLGLVGGIKTYGKFSSLEEAVKMQKELEDKGIKNTTIQKISR